MLVKFEQNLMVQIARNVELSDKKKKKKKKRFLNHCWQRVDAIKEDVSLAEIIG